jgi:AcrR family transcriptional regulator
VSASTVTFTRTLLHKCQLLTFLTVAQVAGSDICYAVVVATETERHVRADAVRNADRILRAARAVFTEAGPDASLEEVARHAGVGIRTLYRHFPTKADLVTAALNQTIADELKPAIERADDHDGDPRQGLITLIEAALCLAAREYSTFAAAQLVAPLPADVSAPFYEALTRLLRRAQETDLIRTDLDADDLRTIMSMLFSTLSTVGSDGWRRYLPLILDGLAPDAANPLPPAGPRRKPQRAAGKPA